MAAAGPTAVAVGTRGGLVALSPAPALLRPGWGFWALVAVAWAATLLAAWLSGLCAGRCLAWRPCPSRCVSGRAEGSPPRASPRGGTGWPSPLKEGFAFAGPRERHGTPAR